MGGVEPPQSGHVEIALNDVPFGSGQAPQAPIPQLKIGGPLDLFRADFRYSEGLIP